MFYTMLGTLEDLTMNKVMKNLIAAYEENNHSDMKFQAHSLKGASAYIGASRIYYTCFYIQAFYLVNNFPKMVSYYPTLVEAVIEFRTFHRDLLAKYNGQLYTAKAEHQTTSFSEKHFRLLKDPTTQYIWCCRHDQSI